MRRMSAFLDTPAEIVMTLGLIVLMGEFLLGLLFWSLHNIYLVDEFEEEIAVGIIAPIILTKIVAPALHILIFRPMGNQQAKLERQLDELKRFQKLTVGRELRIKDLVEENAALRNQLAFVKPVSAQP